MTSFAEAYNAEFHEGVAAFKKKEYGTAVAFFNSEIENNPNNAAAYFNLGLSYNAQKNYPKAIWSFERVLKLTPNNGEAIDNIEQNYLELDNGQAWHSDLSHFNRVLYGVSSNIWAILSVVFSLLCALLIILLRKATSLSKKRAFLLSSFVMAIFMVFSIYVSAETHEYENSHEYGLVTKEKIDTYLNGNIDQANKSEIQLDAGTKVKSLEHWKGAILKVETMKGETYFINQSDIDII